MAEVSGSGYARVEVELALNTQSSRLTNSAPVRFPTATTDWGTVTAFGICTATGELLLSGRLTRPLFVPTGMAPSFEVGSIDVHGDMPPTCSFKGCERPVHGRTNQLLVPLCTEHEPKWNPFASGVPCPTPSAPQQRTAWQHLLLVGDTLDYE